MSLTSRKLESDRVNIILSAFRRLERIAEVWRVSIYEGFKKICDKMGWELSEALDNLKKGMSLLAAELKI